jgi:hypothetical protein
VAAAREVHQALAELTDRFRDPDRRAWHLAAPAPRPDEEVAAELEHSPGPGAGPWWDERSRAFLQRAVEMSAQWIRAGPSRRAGEPAGRYVQYLTVEAALAQVQAAKA